MPKAKNTIVATTDFSVNSRAGIRFAVQLAEKNNAELIFLHVYHVLRASFWSDSKYQYYIRQFEKIFLKEHSVFIKGVLRSLKITPKKYSIAVHHNLDTVDGILDFASKNGASLICCSTHGRGVISKLFGSTTAKLITKSDIPVLGVPSSYRIKPITNVLYSSDLEHYEKELKQVVEFSSPLQANLRIVHIAFGYEKMPDIQKRQMELKKKFKYPVEFDIVKRDTSRSLLNCLKTLIDKTKPSIVVFFTNRKRTFFEQLLAPNNAKEYSYNSKVPFLSIKK